MIPAPRPTIREKTAGLFGKMACIFMIFAVASFAMRFNWRQIRADGFFGIVSDAPQVGFYLALSSLICGFVWAVLAFGLQVPGTKKAEEGGRP
ncbi:MAG TPA: hypothetical protein VIX37_19310 [Candidatus Sulfotelmatobacter sp.]